MKLFKEGNMYLRPWRQRFQSIVIGLHYFWVCGETEHIDGKKWQRYPPHVCRERERGERNKVSLGQLASSFYFYSVWSLILLDGAISLQVSLPPTVAVLHVNLL